MHVEGQCHGEGTAALQGPGVGGGSVFLLFYGASLSAQGSAETAAFDSPIECRSWRDLGKGPPPCMARVGRKAAASSVIARTDRRYARLPGTAASGLARVADVTAASPTIGDPKMLWVLGSDDVGGLVVVVRRLGICHGGGCRPLGVPAGFRRIRHDDHRQAHSTVVRHWIGTSFLPTALTSMAWLGTTCSPWPASAEH